MELKKIEKNGYNLHLIKNKNFKTILVKVIFWEKLVKEELTKRSMLLDNLLFSSSKYNTNKKITIKKQELYGLNMTGGSYRRGNYIFSEINMSVIEDKYTEKGLFKESLEFLFDTILNPNIKEEGFDLETYKINSELIKTDITSIKENPVYYSFIEYKKLLGEDKPFTSILEGNIEDFNKITPNNLYEYYKDFLNKNNIDIMVIGNIDFDSTEKIIEDNFNLDKKSYPMDELYVSYEKELTEDIISSNFSQSRLVMGGSLNDLTLHEKRYEALAYNIILGSSPNSKLFKNIREKHSYAYSISSSINRFDGMFYIYAGISKQNYEDVKREVLNEIENMKKGKFTVQDIKNAKEVMLGVLKEVNDHQNAILNHYFNREYFGNKSLDEQKENINNITKESIIEVAKKINIDTILLVEEKDYEENTNK